MDDTNDCVEVLDPFVLIILVLVSLGANRDRIMQNGSFNMITRHKQISVKVSKILFITSPDFQKYILMSRLVIYPNSTTLEALHIYCMQLTFSNIEYMNMCQDAPWTFAVV